MPSCKMSYRSFFCGSNEDGWRSYSDRFNTRSASNHYITFPIALNSLYCVLGNPINTGDSMDSGYWAIYPGGNGEYLSVTRIRYDYTCAKMILVIGS